MSVERQIPIAASKDLGSKQRRNKGRPYTMTSRYSSSGAWRNSKNNRTPTTHLLLATHARYDTTIRQKCDTCQRTKEVRHAAYCQMKPNKAPNWAWKSISSDFITHLPNSEGNDEILIIIDRLTKMAHFLRYIKDINAQQFSELFMREIFRLQGLPENIIADRGSIFTSDLRKETTKQR